MILGSRRFRIGVVRLDKLLDVLYCFVGGTEEVFFRSMCVDKVIVSSVLNILLGVFHLEVQQHWV